MIHIHRMTRRSALEFGRDQMSFLGSRKGGLARGTRDMIFLHLTKPWVEGNVGIVLCPLRDGLGGSLAGEVFSGYGKTWYAPSIRWWKSHARTSHPPGGKGMSVKAHVDFLTMYGRNAEFLYANVSKDGWVGLLRKNDFENEAKWWRKNVDRP